jgi:hypothetical protein
MLKITTKVIEIAIQKSFVLFLRLQHSLALIVTETKYIWIAI